MTPPARWPLHPAPLEGEALSSWLDRIADTYHMTARDLLKHDLRHGQVPQDDLDVDPPPTLLTILARRSGVELHRLHQMSLAGWVPWLLDSLAPEPATFDTYVRQFSVLLKPGKRSKRAASPSWLPWISAHPVQRACPHCLDDPDRRGLLLMWKLPLQLSCPDHGCRLEPFIGFPGDYPDWLVPDTPPRAASDEVMAMDRRTQQALRTGCVELPRRTVHAGVWFRLLRTILDELSTPVTCWGSRSADLRLAWTSSGHSVRAGQGCWRPFETVPWPIQTQLLEAAATTMQLLETQAVVGRGHHAPLFLPTPQVEVDAGRLSPKEEPSPWELARAAWELVQAAWERRVEAARHDPVTAQRLYDLEVLWCRTPDSLERLRANFTARGIPTTTLSLKTVPAPFP